MTMALPRRFIPSIAGLIAFEATARHLSFSQAARELSLSQGAVSKRVKQLEGTLGVCLLARTKQQVLLTDAGRQYLAEVRRMLDQVEATTYSLMANAGGKAELNLAVLPTFATQWLLPRMSGFNDLHPDIVVNLTTRLTPFDFREERFDGAVHFGRSCWPDARAHYLFDEEIVPVASPSLVDRNDIAVPGDLAKVALIHLSSRPGLWSDWFGLCGGTLQHPYAGPVYDQFSIVIRAAECGVGAALVPRFMVEDEIRRGALCVPFDLPLSDSGTYYFVTPNAKAGDATLGVFCAWLSEQADAYANTRRRTGEAPAVRRGSNGRAPTNGVAENASHQTA